MQIFAVVIIWAWLPISVAIFGTRRPREAALLSFLLAWLFLPSIGFDLPGLPDYTKMTAATMGTFLSICLFDSGRLLRLKPRWYDAPMAIYCGCPLISAITANQGAYDGLSAVVQEVFSWGLPYIIGRIYFTDSGGMSLMARAIALAGLAYIPFILIEIRLSPIFDRLVYGLVNWEGTRFGVFRPRVFFGKGLELGMWMSCTCMAAVALWSSGAVRRLNGIPFGLLTALLVAVTFSMRATGAFVLLAAGIVLFQLCRRLGQSWPAWLLIMAAPLYVSTRVTGTFSGTELVNLAAATTNADQAQSISFRFEQEEILMRSAMQRPLFGWARAGGFNVTASGRPEAVTDGFWIITLGHSGFVGLASLWASLCLPLALATRRFPAKTWNDPDVAPGVSLSILLSLCMLDNLSNAMLNPLYGVIMGGAVALPSLASIRRGVASAGALDEADELGAAGHHAEAAEAYLEVLESPAPEDDPAREGALEGLAGSFLASGRLAEAEAALADLVAARLRRASADPGPGPVRDLAMAHAGRARVLLKLGRGADALDQRLKAADLWAGLASAYPREPGLAAGRAGSLNDLAWFLAVDAPPGLLDPARAAALASDAARIAPDDPAAWNTLGVALLRDGDPAGAVDALLRAVELGRDGGTAFDHFPLAMASYRLGDPAGAREWFGRGEAWAARRGDDHPTLLAFRAESAALLAGGSSSRTLAPR